MSHGRLRERRRDGAGKAFEPIDHGDQDIVDATGLGPRA